MQEKNIKELVISTFKIYKNNIVSIILITILIFIPVSVAQVFIEDSIIDKEIVNDINENPEKYKDTENYEIQAVKETLAEQQFTYMIIAAVISLLGLTGNIAVVKLTYNNANGIKESFMDVFEDSVKRYPKVVLTLLLSYLFIGVGLLLILPGIYFYFLFAFVLHITVVTNLWGNNALKYGVILAKKNLKKVMGFSIFVLVFQFSYIYLTNILFNLIPDNSYIKIMEVIKLSSDNLILCLPTIIFTLLFIDSQMNIDEKINKFFNLEPNKSI